MVIPAKKGSTVAANLRAALSSGRTRLLLTSIVSAAMAELEIITARMLFIIAALP